MDEEDDPWPEDQSVTDEEDDQWADECSSTNSDEELYEEDPEPEPPDPYQDDPHSTDWSRKESDPEEGYESDSWQEETEAENSLEISKDWDHESEEETQLQLNVQEDLWEDQTHTDAEQDDMPWYEDTNSQLKNEEEAISESGRNVKESQLVLAEEEEVESEAGRNVNELGAHSTYFSGYGQRDETYPKWEDEMEALFKNHHVPEEEKLSYATKTLIGPALAWWKREQHAQWYDDDPDHTWKSFKLEILEEFVKKDPDQFPMCPAHEIYALSNPPIFKAGRKQAIHHHSPQEMEPAIRKKTVKKKKSSQLSSLQLTRVLDTVLYPKGTLQPERKKAGVFLESIKQEDERPNNAKRSKENQGQHLTCPQNVEEDAISHKSTQAVKEQIILQLAETVLIISGTEAKDPIGDPHKEVRRCLDAKVKQEVTTRNFLIPDDPPVDEPEANQLHQAANPKTNQDMCSVKMAYLTNQEEVFHETNFNTFYATKGVEPNWNHHQSYSEHKYMNFTNRRFSIPSICEYRSLEVVYSQTKKLSGPKKIMEIKMDLVDFQQAKNEDKNPRKYGVMINFPKPDKSVLHLPYLEAAGSINCKPDIDDQERHLTI
ncbi:hypothetical protein F2Q68_00025211 [Brassica cretica]|uniref:Retrotransposon gag domain-containing protein n=1 Tax=Brassica cretica TaxID=69181 RepID=A0A8S9IDL7_BRACR|nr:hypothetical protein F2Q68_00025211 [Brassica cretica]